LARGRFAPTLKAKGLIVSAKPMRAVPRAPAGWVRRLFDQFAADYDRRVIHHLS
jgi:predicted TPR repeat methyltransferase